MAERDENGRFVKGYSGGPGRPKKEREIRFYEVTLSAVSLDTWKEIVRKASDQARRGDAQARKWLGDYLVGPAIQRIEASGLDGKPIQVDMNLLLTVIDKIYGRNTSD